MIGSVALALEIGDPFPYNVPFRAPGRVKRIAIETSNLQSWHPLHTKDNDRILTTMK